MHVSFTRPPALRARQYGSRCCACRPGDVQFPIVFGYSFLSDTYPDVSWCILHVSWLYLNVSRSYTSRYIKIHQDTFVSCCLWHFSCILPRGMYPPSKIHLGYISDTMYLVFQIHDTQDTFKIHSGYVWDISRYTSRYVSRAYLGLVWDTCRIHIDAKCQDTCILLKCNRACKIHLRYIRIHSRYVYLAGYAQDTSRYIRIRIR
jgi:hypothetical protein